MQGRRPELPKKGLERPPLALETLILDCWKEAPEDRRSMDEVLR